jgi:hypothetical protein
MAKRDPCIAILEVHLANLGHRLEAVGKYGKHKLVFANGSEQTFGCLADVWSQCRWCAAFLLTPAIHLGKVVERYTVADDIGRFDMRAWASGEAGTAWGARFASIEKSDPGISGDNLPDDWMEKVERIHGSPDATRSARELAVDQFRIIDALSEQAQLESSLGTGELATRSRRL